MAQDTVTGMASSAPAATIGLVLAGLAAATAYGSGPVLLLTAVPMLVIVYYRRRVFGSARDALILGLLPLGAAGFLGWMLVRTLQNSPSTQRWSLIGIVALGLVMLLIARFVLRSPFFSIRRESDTRAS